MDIETVMRILVPLTTFALGILATYFFQRHWRQRDTVASSAKALAELTADWYNQLDDLWKAVEGAAEGTEKAELVDRYLRNRLILPKILYHVAVLRERDAFPQLVLEVEGFLSLVTSHGKLGATRALTCTDVLSTKYWDLEPRASFAHTLTGLDELQQSVVREAARAGP